MKQGYSFSPKAEDDLANILRYSIRQFGLAQSKKYQKLLVAAFEGICENPEGGKTRLVLDSEYGFRYLRTGRHYIFYKLIENHVYIIRILHEKMNFSAHLP